MKDKRQRVALAWPYGLAAESALYAYLVNAAAAAATSAHLSHHFPFAPGTVHGMPPSHHLPAQGIGAVTAQHQTATSPVSLSSTQPQHHHPPQRPGIDGSALQQRHLKHDGHMTTSTPTTPILSATPGCSPGPNQLGFPHMMAVGYPIPHPHGQVNGLGTVQVATSRVFANGLSQPMPPHAAQFPFSMRFGLPVSVPPPSALQVNVDQSSSTPTPTDRAGFLNLSDPIVSGSAHQSPRAIYGGTSAVVDGSPSSLDVFPVPVSSSSSSLASSPSSSTGASSRRAPCGLFQPYKTDNAEST